MTRPSLPAWAVITTSTGLVRYRRVGSSPARRFVDRKTKAAADWLESRGVAADGTSSMGDARSVRAESSGTRPRAFPRRPGCGNFHVVDSPNTKPDECRRRVQSYTIGHRERENAPLLRCRCLLIKADEGLDDNGSERLLGLLDAGDPQEEVCVAWHADLAGPLRVQPPRQPHKEGQPKP